MIPLGQVEKMQIQSFTDPSASRQPLSPPFTFMVNPSSYNERFNVQYNQEQAPGTSGAHLKYQYQPPPEWEFEILIDGTGVIKDASALNLSILGAVTPVDVEAEINKLKAATIDIQSETHRNAYVIVSWGNRKPFKGSLVSLDLNYKLFKPDGTPLRVVAKVKLRAWVSDEERTHQEALQSPDITHERLYIAGDIFTTMAFNIYNESTYYIDVAKANKLISFRRIKHGLRIKFPPLK